MPVYVAANPGKGTVHVLFLFLIIKKQDVTGAFLSNKAKKELCSMFRALVHAWLCAASPWATHTKRDPEIQYM